MITFYVALGPTRIAWQRREWHPAYTDWGGEKLQEAIECFLQAAERQSAAGITGGREVVTG